MSLLSASVPKARRRTSATTVVALLTILVTLLYFHLSVIRTKNATGSDFIYKSPYGEDKAVVMARMSYEDVSWVSEELFE